MVNARILVVSVFIPLLLIVPSQSGSCGRSTPVNKAGSNAKNSNQSARPKADQTKQIINQQAPPKNSGGNDMSITPGEDTERRSKALVPLGTWGGVHIRMIVSADGANIEYDCARGAIAGKLRLDNKGRFELTGTHMREGPGPIRLGKVSSSRPARYSGEVSGNEMSLTVTATDTSEELGTFKLTRGSEGFIRKCR